MKSIVKLTAATVLLYAVYHIIITVRLYENEILITSYNSCPERFETLINSTSFKKAQFVCYVKYKNGEEVVRYETPDNLINIITIKKYVFNQVNYKKEPSKFYSGYFMDPFSIPFSKTYYQIGKNSFNRWNEITLKYEGNLLSTSKDSEYNEYAVLGDVRNMSVEVNNSRLFGIQFNRTAKLDFFIKDFSDASYLGLVYYK